MNSVKNTALVLLLAGAAYLAYQHIYGRPGSPPPGVPEQSAGVPKVDVPGLGGEAPPFVPGKIPPSPSSGPQTPNPATEAKPAPRTPSAPRDPLRTARSDAGADSPQAPPGRATAADPTAPEQPRRRPDHEIGEQFVRCMTMANELLERDQYADVLIQLSQWYNHPDLTRAESRKLVELLDQLAGSVIYSREHRLEEAYRVKPGDTLPQIARAYNVPWELLAKINGIRDPEKLDGVRELKVVRGPFHAVVQLDQREITLMLESRDDKGTVLPVYAGRFPVRVAGTADVAGEYEVLRKSPGPREGAPGALALELNNRVTIHGPAQSAERADRGAGIELGEREIEDVYDILTVGSRVRVCR